MLTRALVLLLGSVAAFLCLWGSWEIAGHVGQAPQAIVGVVGFALLGILVGAGSILGALTGRG